MQTELELPQLIIDVKAVIFVPLQVSMGRSCSWCIHKKSCWEFWPANFCLLKLLNVFPLHFIHSLHICLKLVLKSESISVDCCAVCVCVCMRVCVCVCKVGLACCLRLGLECLVLVVVTQLTVKNVRLLMLLTCYCHFISLIYACGGSACM